MDKQLGDVAIRSNSDLLRTLAISSGICWSVLFVVIGLWNELELFADGSFFSYSVAAQDAWSFWHNNSGRLFVYLFAHVPAQTYVGLTTDAQGGVAIYGFLFFVAPLLGLAATFALDRSKGRILFSYASLSTACLCPLVFGFPTETWISHALFWPTLALCHQSQGGTVKIALIFATLLALVFTHEGALIFAFAILITLWMRGTRNAAFLRALGVFFVIMLIWVIVKTTFPPDEVMAVVLKRAALHVFDPTIILTGYLVVLFFAVAVLYAIALYVFWRLNFIRGHFYATLIVAVGLAVYWAWIDYTLHAENRYYLRTLILIGTPAFGMVAVMHALKADGRLFLHVPFLPRLMTLATNGAIARTATGALALVLLVHTVETAKFVKAWAQYRGTIRQLAMGQASDPALGDPNFVSSLRIDAKYKPLAWSSTTHFLSVLLAPGFAPARFVVDPYAGFFWLSCKAATANLKATRAVPAKS